MAAEGFDFELDETALQELYTWIDEIPLSRPKKNISRDFSDGVLVAEIIHHFLPKLIDLHNYVSANSHQAKTDNWNLLMRKVFSKLGYQIPNQMEKDIIASKPGQIEMFLYKLRHKIETFQAKKKAASLRERDQVYDELGGEVSSRTEDYYSDNYPYPDGQTSYRPYQNGQNVNFGTDYGSGSFGHNPISYPPLNQQNQQTQQIQQMQQTQQIQQTQQQYYYQSEPRVAPDNRGLPQNGGDVMRQQKPPNEMSPRSKQKGKSSEKGLLGSEPVKDTNEVQSLRMALEEKEQALLSSQETVQILQVKVRRLEHLLHLKTLRIDDLTNKVNGNHQIPPQNIPQQNFSSPGHLPQNLPPQSYGQMPPIKQHPPLPGITPKAGIVKHYR